MGKRPIGELPVFDLLSIIVMGAIVGADIAQPEIEHMPTAFAVIILALYQKLVTTLMIKSRKIRKFITFEPTIIIENGKFLYKNIKHINYTLDDILMLLREKGVFDITSLKFGIIEASGNLSILKKPEYESPTLKDMKLTPTVGNISFSIILDGDLQVERIKELGFSKVFVLNKLSQLGFNNYSEIFFASMNDTGEINISTYNEKNKL
jgi:uncharacterized membrane protein YcaP (DUF421 family)